MTLVSARVLLTAAVLLTARPAYGQESNDVRSSSGLSLSITGWGNGISNYGIWYRFTDRLMLGARGIVDIRSSDTSSDLDDIATLTDTTVARSTQMFRTAHTHLYRVEPTAMVTLQRFWKVELTLVSAVGYQRKVEERMDRTVTETMDQTDTSRRQTSPLRTARLGLGLQLRPFPNLIVAGWAGVRAYWSSGRGTDVYSRIQPSNGTQEVRNSTRTTDFSEHGVSTFTNRVTISVDF